MPAQQHSVRHITNICKHTSKHNLTCNLDLPLLDACVAEQRLEGGQLAESEDPEVLPDDAVTVLLSQVMEDALVDVVRLRTDALQVALQERGAVGTAFVRRGVDELVLKLGLVCEATNRVPWTCGGPMYKLFKTFRNICKHLQTHRNFCKHTQNICKHCKTFANIPKHLQTATFTKDYLVAPAIHCRCRGPSAALAAVRTRTAGPEGASQ